jgi:ribosomal-protein-alanine N-acetyltransferase
LIVKAQTDDIKDILSLAQEEFHNSWTKLHFLSEIDKKNTLFYVLKIDNKLCGYIVAYDLKVEAEIAYIAISKKIKRKGYATILLNYILSKLSAGTECFLEVNIKNQPAIMFYKKVGFEKVGLRKKYYGNDDALIMKLKI